MRSRSIGAGEIASETVVVEKFDSVISVHPTSSFLVSNDVEPLNASRIRCQANCATRPAATKADRIAGFANLLSRVARGDLKASL